MGLSLSVGRTRGVMIWSWGTEAWGVTLYSSAIAARAACVACGGRHEAANRAGQWDRWRQWTWPPPEAGRHVTRRGDVIITAKTRACAPQGIQDDTATGQGVRYHEARQ